MARERANRDYTVGYRKPPQGTRFKKGQSGNPKGRRKGVPNLSTLIITIMEEPVIVNEGGKRKAIGKAEAMMKQLANRALRRLIINIPPRHLKSLCASVALPPGCLDMTPQRRSYV